VFDALTQASSAPMMQPYAAPAPAPAPEHNFPEHHEPAQQGAPGGFEEVAESIVEEKWHELTRDLGKIGEWKDQVTSRVDRLEQSISELRSNLENLHRAIVARISEYDKTLLDIGTEIKAMERVFSKALPELTESISELGRMTKAAKGEAAKAAAPKK
jgi:prefoldin subunit 5